MANGHGGARPGAGRRAKAEKYGGQIAAAEDRIADRLDKYLDTLEELAEGGYEKRTRKLQAAGTLFVDGILRDDNGCIFTDDNGGPITGKVPAFPGLDPNEMVCVEETHEELAPDRAANIYLIDRILGKPTQAVELSGPDGEAIDVTSGVMTEAAKELELWRKKMTEQLSSMPSAPPTAPISPTPTG